FFFGLRASQTRVEASLHPRVGSNLRIFTACALLNPLLDRLAPHTKPRLDAGGGALMDRNIRRLAYAAVGALVVVASSAGAEEAAAAAPKLDTGDTAWMLTSTALVLMMTIPGLFLFYGGLVRSKNVLSTLMHSFFCAALISVTWVIYGYSLA